MTTTDRPPSEAAQLSFVTALAVADTASRWAPADLVRLKWPNDVMLGGAKVSGILIESGQTGEGGLWLAIGVGINLAGAPEGIDYPATDLASRLLAGREPPGQDEAMAALAEQMAARLAQWSQSGFVPVREAWLERAYALGQQCVARVGEGALRGVAEGLDVDGALLLRLDSGEVRRITAGDVFFGGS